MQTLLVAWREKCLEPKHFRVSNDLQVHHRQVVPTGSVCWSYRGTVQRWLKFTNDLEVEELLGHKSIDCILNSHIYMQYNLFGYSHIQT